MNRPDDIDEIMYHLYVIDKIRKGRDASEKGDTISIDALKDDLFLSIGL